MRNYFRSVQFLTNGLFYLGGLILLGGSAIIHAVYGYIPVLLQYGLMILALTLINTGSIFIIIKKEAPRPNVSSITGIPAILIGIFGIGTFGTVEVLMIYFFLQMLFTS